MSSLSPFQLHLLFHASPAGVCTDSEPALEELECLVAKGLARVDALGIFRLTDPGFAALVANSDGDSRTAERAKGEPVAAAEVEKPLGSSHSNST